MTLGRPLVRSEVGIKMEPLHLGSDFAVALKHRTWPAEIGDNPCNPDRVDRINMLNDRNTLSDIPYVAPLLGNIRQILTGLQGFDSMARELIQNADDAGARKIRLSIEQDCLRGGPGCLNSFSASMSGASAGVRLPSGEAAG